MDKMKYNWYFCVLLKILAHLVADQCDAVKKYLLKNKNYFIKLLKK